jgi:hopanoid biosynthesis associated protein HpnK
MKRVVLTADDFGLSLAVNEGIERAHLEGVLDAASLMVAGDAVEDAVRRARKMPDLRVGLHVVAVEGKAVLPPPTIPDLVDADGWFPSDQVTLGFRYAFSRRARAQLALEVAAQFAAFAATGLRFAHVDAHKHMHMSLYIGTLLARNARAYSVPRMRIPAEPPSVMKAAGTTTGVGGWAMYQWSRVLRSVVSRDVPTLPDAVFGVAWSGHMTEARLLRLISVLPEGESEIYFHPAARRDAVIDRLMPEYEHEAELAALLSPAVRTALGRTR